MLVVYQYVYYDIYATNIMKLLSGLFAILLIVGLVFLSGCTDSSVSGVNGAGEGDTIYISGAFALYPMMIKWSEEYKKVNPDVNFEISAGGAGKGMTDVLSGMVDLGMVSREIYPEEQSQGAIWVAVAKDAVVGTMNSDNPGLETVRKYGVTQSDLKEIYVNNSVTNWDQLSKMSSADSEINVYTRADACGAASVWAKYIGDYAQEDISGIAVSGDPGLAEAVRADKYGVGFNNINYAYDPTTGLPVEGLAILPLDLNENGIIDPEEDFYSTSAELLEAIANGVYPSPPARELNIVTKDEFSGATKEFVKWILTDGQQYVEETGYIPLSSEALEEYLERVG